MKKKTINLINASEQNISTYSKMAVHCFFFNFTGIKRFVSIDRLMRYPGPIVPGPMNDDTAGHRLGDTDFDVSLLLICPSTFRRIVGGIDLTWRINWMVLLPPAIGKHWRTLPVAARKHAKKAPLVSEHLIERQLKCDIHWAGVAVCVNRQHCCRRNSNASFPEWFSGGWYNNCWDDNYCQMIHKNVDQPHDFWVRRIKSFGPVVFFLCNVCWNQQWPNYIIQFIQRNGSALILELRK